MAATSAVCSGDPLLTQQFDRSTPRNRAMASGTLRLGCLFFQEENLLLCVGFDLPCIPEDDACSGPCSLITVSAGQEALRDGSSDISKSFANAGYKDLRNIQEPQMRQISLGRTEYCNFWSCTLKDQDGVIVHRVSRGWACLAAMKRVHFPQIGYVRFRMIFLGLCWGYGQLLKSAHY